MQSFDLLVHFDCEELLILAYDALSCELGTVLSHCMQNGSERLIAFALYPSGEEIHCILTRKHCSSPLELSNYQYLYNRQVIIYSDHKPPMYDKAKSVPLMASAQIQHHL